MVIGVENVKGGDRNLGGKKKKKKKKTENVKSPISFSFFFCATKFFHVETMLIRRNKFDICRRINTWHILLNS